MCRPEAVKRQTYEDGKEDGYADGVSEADKDWRERLGEFIEYLKRRKIFFVDIEDAVDEDTAGYYVAGGIIVGLDEARQKIESAMKGKP